MNYKLTKLEDGVLWLLQRKSRIIDLTYALKKTREEVIEIVEKLALKTGISFLTVRDIDKGRFYKVHGVHVPFGER